MTIPLVNVQRLILLATLAGLIFMPILLTMSPSCCQQTGASLHTLSCDSIVGADPCSSTDDSPDPLRCPCSGLSCCGTMPMMHWRQQYIDNVRVEFSINSVPASIPMPFQFTDIFRPPQV